MDEFELDPSMPVHKAMIAGATAGVMEHCFMYPVDTVKSILQAEEGSARRSISEVIRSERIWRLYRGIGAVALGAIPSHAANFATYETVKNALGGNREGHHPVINGFAGATATMAHDAVVTPLDLVKQRMQVYPQLYPTLRSTIASTYRASGLRGFYASYPVTVAMNVPHMSAYFAAYESLKLMLSPDNSEAELGPVQHLLAGGGAGAIAACVSTPLDVVKTRLQLSSALSASATSSASAPLGAMSAARAAVSTAATASTASAAAFSSSAPHLAPPSISEIIRHIYAAEGWRGFTRGMTARMLYFAPSAAICWTTYEAAKAVLMASE